ncbi:MAG: RtcB family protein [Aeromonas sp.]
MEFITNHNTHLVLSKDFNSSMKVSATIYTNKDLSPTIFTDHKTFPDTSSLTQLSRVCSLPGVVGVCALFDLTGGYGCPIGSVAAFNMETGIISPIGVGFDINCGVRSLATNLIIEDILSIKAKLGDLLFERIPSGMGKSTKTQAG